MANELTDSGILSKANLHPFSAVKKVIAVIGGKGGVGKSTVCAMLAVTMRRRGFNVGILDADLTGPSIPAMFGIKEQAQGSNEGIYPSVTAFGIEVMSMNLLLEDPTEPVVWRGAVASAYVKNFFSKVIWTDLDYLFIDMPPGTGDIPLTVLSVLPVDGVVVVSTPQQLAGMIAEKAVIMAEKLKIPVLGAVRNQSYYICDGCKEKVYPFGNADAKFVSKHNIELTAEIPFSSDLARQADKGLTELFEGDFLEEFCDGLEKKC